MTKRKRILELIIVVLLVYMSGGCEGPENIGRFRATPITNIILDELGVIDEDPEIFSGAREPRPLDLVPSETEYAIGSGDILDISIYELIGPGQEWMGRKQVSEVGRITIPEIGTFRAAGKTELELTEMIENLLSPRIVKDPMVTVVVSGARKKVYSIAGAVAAPGPYILNESDFRISRALAGAGGIPQMNADNAYVIRTRGTWPGEGVSVEMESLSEEPDIWLPSGSAEKPDAIPSGFERTFPDIEGDVPPVHQDPKAVPPLPRPLKPKREQDELLESITPMSVVTPGMEMKKRNSIVSETIHFSFSSEDNPSPLHSQPPQPPPSGWRLVRKGNRFELVPDEVAAPLELAPGEKVHAGEYEDLPVEPGRGDFGFPQGAPSQPGLETGWEDEGLTVGQQEVIKVDLKKLRGGDWTQNIVIRPGDDIQVPFNATGIYSVMGQVFRPGAYSLAGQRLTLKQVISTAGPLTGLAWPSRCEIIRRLGENKEVTYLVNLEKLFAGTSPDLFIKPNDIINVGSHPVARWAAVIRQSFRSTYGFGFVYDRNFADKDMGR